MHPSRLTTLKKILWVTYLVIAVVFIQGLRVHVHTYSHDPVTLGHAHQQQVHVDFDVSEEGHPDEVGQIDLSQQEFLQKLTLGSLVIALLAAVIILLQRRLCSHVTWRPHRRVLLVSWPFSLRPPLRAPPL